MFVCCASWCCDGCGKKILMTNGNLQQYQILQYIIFEDDLLIRNHDVTLFCIVTLLQNKQFFTAAVVRRRDIVSLYEVILHFVEDFLRNNNSKTLSGYYEKRNN
jgi:hypothetical protein